MLLRVLGLTSGVCLVLDPVFPEVAHRGPSLNLVWGGDISHYGAPYTFCPFVMCMCVHVIVVVGAHYQVVAEKRNY